jgi:hypothetical protein
MRHFRFYPRFDYCDHYSINLLVRSKIRDKLKEEGALYYETTIRDGERPDTLSRKYYGSPDYAWVILYANDIMNPLTEWVYFGREFEQYIIKKYGSMRRALNNVHHYELNDPNGQTYIIDEKTFFSGNYTPTEVSAITIFEYEERLNEERRNIKVIDNVYLRQLVSELNQIFG